MRKTQPSEENQKVVDCEEKLKAFRDVFDSLDSKGEKDGYKMAERK